MEVIRNLTSVFDLSLVRKLKLPIMTGLATVYNITASFEEIAQNVIFYLPRRKTLHFVSIFDNVKG